MPDIPNYAWGRGYLQKPEGEYMCNFKQVDECRITFDERSQHYLVVEDPYVFASGRMMSPVNQYPPSPYGLYNMNGNVAEMVTDSTIAVGGCWNSPGYDVRNESVMDFDGPSIYVGFRPMVIVTRKTAQ
jgi:formylglycine-generating enzyme required for sulfatase activity